MIVTIYCFRLWYILLSLFAFSQICSSQTIPFQQTSGPTGGSASTFAFLNVDSVFVGSNSGLYLSKDGGKLWTRISEQEIEPTCVTHSRTIIAVHENTCYRSTDRGKTWSETTVGSEIYSIEPIVHVSKLGSLFITKQDGIYRSINDGISWSKIHSMDVPFQSLFTIDSSNYIYMNVRDSGIIRSKDEGKSWSKLTTNKSTEGNNYCYSIIASGNYMYVGAYYGVYISTNKGSTWRYDSTSIKNLVIKQLISNSKGYVYARTSFGLYRTTDNGKTWLKLPFFPYDQEMSNIQVNSNGQLYVSTVFDGVITSTDDGLTWEEINEGFISTTVLSMFNGKQNKVYACVGRRGLFYTTNQGDIWSKTSSPYPLCIVSSGVASSDGTIVIVCDTSGMYRSSDDGKSWAKCREGDPVTPIILIDKYDQIYTSMDRKCSLSRNLGDTWEEILNITKQTSLGDIAFDTSSNIWLSGFDTLYTSSDKGYTWTMHPFLTDNDNAFINKFVIDENNYFYGQTAFGIYKSANAGLSWTLIDSGNYSSFPELLINSQGNLFSTSNINQVRRSIDTGNSWHSFSDGLLGKDIVTSLSMDEKDFLYAGVYWNGVYRSQKSTNKISYSQNSNLTYSTWNYDKVSGDLTILVTLPTTSRVKLVVYSPTGQRIGDVINNQLYQNSYTAVFRASHLPTGVYSYVLTIGDHIERKQFLIMH